MFERTSESAKVTRRSALKMIGGGALTTGIPAITSAEDNGEITKAEKKRVYEEYRKKYPENEARYAANRWYHYQTKLHEGKVEQTQAFKLLTDDLLQNTIQIADDIEKANKLRNNGIEYDPVSTQSIPVKQGASASDDWVELSRTGFKNRDCGGTAIAECRLVDPLMLEENCTSFGYGNATALVERGGGYGPSTSGTHDVQVKYYRKGVVDSNGTASITVFAQELANPDVEYTEVTDRGDTNGDVVTKTVQFDLDTGVNGYKIGVRLQGSVSGIGKELVSDYYAGQRGVELQHIKIRES